MSTPPLRPDLERLLIVAPTWIGDTVMATPAFRAIRSGLPDSEITIAVRPGQDGLLAGSGTHDHLHPVNPSGGLGLWRSARALHAAQPSAILLFPNSFRSALLARLVGAPTRIGFARDGRGLLLTHALPAPTARPCSAVDWYADLAAAALGAEVDDRRLELVVRPEEEEAAEHLLRGVEPPFVLFNPGANREDKRWPIERFAELARVLVADHDVRCVATGGPTEADLLGRLEDAAAGAVVNLVERGITLAVLKSVAQRAAVMVTNDTGPRHIAAAVGTPIVTLFGPTDPRWTTLTGIQERALVGEPFLPETLVADDHPKSCRIDRISVGDVAAAVAESLVDRPG